MKRQDIITSVRKNYAKIAKGEQKSCCSSSGCSCSPSPVKNISKGIGYSDDEMNSVPEGANLGLGCGNPVALASLKKGEVVLDLGSGAGFDAFLSAKKVGNTGKVIGIDMTPEMIEKARNNARKGKYSNVEFRLGEIENLPVADNSADIIISNCVINLSPDKKRVFKEAFRVLKPGGRLMVSDIVLSKELPEFVKESAAAYSSCIAGAMLKDKYIGAIEQAGFKNVKIISQANFPIDYMENDPIAETAIKDLKMSAESLKKIASTILSIKVYAVKTMTAIR